MQVNPHIFRGYDLRGIVDQDLNPEIVEHLGKAHGTYMKRHGVTEAVVGYDSRATSREYADALIRGFQATGIDTIDIGMTMVGTFYWAQHYLKRPGGAFITASHNPANYNGMKFAIGLSETLVSEGIQAIRQMVETEEYDLSDVPGNVIQQDIHDAYTTDLKQRFPNIKSSKVLIDASCGTAGVVAPRVLGEFGLELIEKNTNLDPTFPLGTPDPTESSVAERVRDGVLETGADVGFTYDVDGDRIGIVDEKGGIIWNDVLVALFAIDVLHTHPGATIMYNTLCSKLVDDTIIKYGGKPFMWRTGHSFLKKKNQEVGAAFIGELSGHFFFSADFYNHDDGLYSTLRLLDYLSRTGQTLSEAISKLPQYVSSPEVKIYCADDKKIALMDKVAPILKEDYPDAEVIDDQRAGDGLRLELSDGMFVVRYSQNGPYLTVKFEGKTQNKYNELKKYINELLHRFEEVDWASEINVNTDALE